VKRVAETLLTLIGVVVFFFSLSHADFWGMALGAGLVFAPFTAGGMFLLYIAIIGIPFGAGLLLAVMAKEAFGPGIIVGIAFFAGILLGGKFVVSDAFDRVFRAPRSDATPRQGDRHGP
jgi:hypothetical protein